VPQTPEKLSESIADLPNPELNPLLNPVLGRHLGQWAHVYFTTAPEKREEALFELIEDLKAEESRNAGTPPADSAVTTDGMYAIVCPRCERSNLRSQKYCGMCGAPMPVRAQAAAASSGGPIIRNAMFEPYPVTDEPVDDAAKPGEMASGLDVQMESRSPFAATSLLFQPGSGQTVDRSARSEHIEPALRSEPVDIDWLRQKNFPSQVNSRSGIQNYLMGIAVVLCIGILVFLLAIRQGSGNKGFAKQKPPVNWNITQNAPTPMPTVESGGVASTAHPPATNADVPQAQPPIMSSKTGEGKADSSHTPAPSAADSASSQRQVRKHAAPATVAPVTPESDADALEVSMAKQYLSGTNGHPDGAAAAEVLWKAVGKGNSAALLMLSDLYASGNGVPKNCDQARLLLQAALRRSVAGAVARMQELPKTCP
jgi:hypothetical protein